MLSTDPLESAAEAGLRYVNGSGPCIRRIRSGKGFRYTGADGGPVRDPRHLARIRSLAIPPAWKDVWICPSSRGHLQAVGWDARGRKQYRYHPLYRAVRDQAKFSRMIAFGTVLALIRRRVAHDLRRPGLPKDKVLAAVVRLLETTFIRVGNEEYMRENDSFGLTTLRGRHVRIAGSRLLFRFRGKSGQEHSVELTDRRLAKIVKDCQELPGYELFHYSDPAGHVCSVDSADVNAYIRHACGGHDFTAKDFRTWAGTILAVREFRAAGPAASVTAAKRTVVSVTRAVARHLRNRPATCRKYYIHPAVIDAFTDGSLFPIVERGEEQHGLRPEEYAVMVVIAEHQQKLAKAKAA